MWPSSLGVVIIVAATVLFGIARVKVAGQSWQSYPEYGADIRGRFCGSPTGRCCQQRDDHCTVPILDTVCYCDQFCVRSQGDCCPDFTDTCIANPHPIKAKNNCYHGDVLHPPGSRVKINCNECTCEQSISVLPEYTWNCTQKTCIVREQLVDHINTKTDRYGWRAANYSFLWERSLIDGIKNRLGTFRPLSVVQAMTPLRVYNISDVPESFDAREKWPNYIHPILDQGDCGSSWAFSTASVAADRLTIHSLGVYDQQLSAQQIIDCDIDYHQKGCNGGHIDRAWWYMRTKGVVSEACYPYKSGFTGKKNKCLLPRHLMRPSATSCPAGSGIKSPVYQVSPPYRIAPHEKEIMKEIIQNGPVQALMHVKEDFFLYKGGVYRHTLPANYEPPNKHLSGYHTVKILGWGTDYTTGKPLKYWLCANSWGRKWGEDGYFRILRGTNESEIESFIVGVWAKVNGRELRHQNREAFSKRRLRHQLGRTRHRRHSKRK